MANINSQSKLERIGSVAALLLAGAYALFSGGQALLTGEFVAFGVRGSSPTHYIGIKAYLSGLFITAVGVTFLLAPLLGMRREKIVVAMLAFDFLLFGVAVGSYVLA